MDEVLEQVQTIDVDGYTFEVTPQDGCISQCLVLDEGQAQPPPDQMDAITLAAIEMREQGEIILTEDDENVGA